MRLRTYQVVFRILIKMQINKAIQFKMNNFLEVVTSVFYLIINIVFWRILFYLGYNLPGWSYSDTVVFIAFSEFFFGFHSAVFASLSRFWMLIITGKLDAILVRPIDSRIRLLILNINYIELVRTLLFFALLLFYSEKEISIVNVAIGMIVSLISLYILSLIQLTISYFAFHMGKVEAINELSDSFTVLNKYPATIFPKLFFNISRICLPFLFFSTFPAQIVNNLLSRELVVWGSIGILANVVLWTTIHNYIWRRGLAIYESYNG